MRKYLVLLFILSLITLNSIVFADAVDYDPSAYMKFDENGNYIYNYDDYDINDSTDENILYVNPNTGYSVVIEDDAHLFDVANIDGFLTQMIPCTDYGNIILKTIDSNSNSTSNFARDYYHSIFGSLSGTMFIIDMANREIYIFSDGDNYKTITNTKATIITDNVYIHASRKDYYNCALRAFEQINTLLSGGKIFEKMKIISNLLLSLTIAFIITFWYIMKKSKVKVASSNDIIKNCNINFKINNMNAVHNGQRSVYSPQSSSSSGGGGSSRGGGGGGGSSGGGGGHRF